jgi:hypothetical protein
MRFSTSFLVAASMLFTVHAHDKDWRLPEEAGAVAARAVAARATAARAAAANAFNPPVSGAIEPEEPPLRLLHECTPDWRRTGQQRHRQAASSKYSSLFNARHGVLRQADQ